jgi:hypothetical protein
MITTETIIYPNEYWMNSQLSIARYYGGCIINDKGYIIVNKEGKDLFECSAEAEREGRTMAIEAGEPADLILKEWQPIYRALGRDKLFEYLKTQSCDLKEAKKYVKQLKEKKK